MNRRTRIVRNSFGWTIALATTTFATLAAVPTARAELTVGGKAFTEAYVLGEWLAARIEETDPVTRRLGLGGTGILYESLIAGDVQFYVEYTGTIGEAILRRRGLSIAELRRELAKRDLVMSEPLGFSNDYALATTAEFAKQHNLRTIADLARVGDRARGAFSYEFLERGDGLRALSVAYGLRTLVDSPAMEHALAYEALTRGRADVTDVYTTDAKIERLGLKVLTDPKHFFGSYQAVILTRADVARAHPALWRRLNTLRLTESTVRGWNAAVDLDGLGARAVVTGKTNSPSTWATEVPRRAREHATLVGLALLFSVLVGIPLGVVAYARPLLGQAILLASGTVQTIPSLALLCFLIPIAGIGTGSALVALCLYGLLPIVANTLLGLRSIDPGLIEMARALKMTRWQRLRHVEIPLASRALLDGVRTSAVISIGTATLAALIGAGGFGATIMSGLAVNDVRLIWAGALPAAVMALLVQGMFSALVYVVIPRGLRD